MYFFFFFYVNLKYESQTSTERVTDEYRQVTDNYRRVTAEYRRVTDDYRRATDDYRRVTDDYRRVTDESQTNTDESQASHRRLRRIIPKDFLNRFIKHYFQKKYGFQMPLWKGGYYLKKESLRFDVY